MNELHKEVNFETEICEHLPVTTVELKSDFTQSVADAVDQCRFDRHPRPKGQGSAEPLLSFPKGALVHFAASQMKVMVTTRLEGAGSHKLSAVQSRRSRRIGQSSE